MLHSHVPPHSSSSHPPLTNSARVNRKTQIYRSFLRGMVKLFVLQKAEKGPVYGGALSKALSGLGYDISPGSLYPLLHALETEKLLHCHTRIASGRVRKYYELTDAGRACLAELREDLAGLVAEVVFAGKSSLAKH